MGMTMTEKILARAAGRDAVRPGEVVRCSQSRFRGGHSAQRPHRTELRGAVWPPMLMNVLRAGGIIPLLETEHLLLPQAH